jgi:hypothetical protein
MKATMCEIKVCGYCKVLKTFDEFSKNKNTKDGLQPICRLCNNAISKQWRTNNPIQARENVREWHKKHPQRVKKIKQAWANSHIEEERKRLMKYRQENPDVRRKAARKYQTKKYATLNGNLNHRMSTSIGISMNGNKCGRKWESLVGYTLDDLKKHIEKQFSKGMTWDNRDMWHIDHIIPISAFNFEKPEDIDFQRCWNLKNLQPLWATENLKKNDKIDKPFQPSLNIGVYNAL